MSRHSYATPMGGHPPQTEISRGRAVMTDAYVFIPKGVMRDIVTSSLPGWRDSRFWVLARPLSGFAETFSQYIAELAPGGGSDQPETDTSAEAVLFVLSGEMTLTLDDTEHALTPGSYVFLPPKADWSIWNTSQKDASFSWIRKKYQPAPGVDMPVAFVTHEDNVTPDDMPECESNWVTTRFVQPDDMRHDMHVNIITIQPGTHIPFPETHVMEHGLYVLEGRGVYQLNQDWIEVEWGDYMWLRAFCPQRCYAGGPGPFRYLLYKDVNRHMPLERF